MRVAKNDVVRIKRTGEVGTVEGWAEHARLKSAAINVKVSAQDSRTLTVGELEFVADAKPVMTKVKSWATLVLLALALVGGGWVGWSLWTEFDMAWYGSAAIGMFTFMGWFRAFHLTFLRPRKTKVG